MPDPASTTAELIPTMVAAGAALHIAKRSFESTTGRKPRTYSKKARRVKRGRKKRQRRPASGVDRIISEFKPRR